MYTNYVTKSNVHSYDTKMRGGSILHVHVVQRGDTLWKISRQYGVSFDEVKRLNAHLANPDYIVPGMKIFVPDQMAKTNEMNDHPYNNDRPVKKHKEDYTFQPEPKPMPEPMAPPKPTMQPKPMPEPMPMPQPTMQMPQQPMPQPIHQHLNMTQMMPPYMGVPYGWIPIPDMDAHQPQKMPTTQMPKEPPKPPVAPMPAPTQEHPQGWQLEDSSSLCEGETSSLEMPMMPPQYHHPSPCGCGQQEYAQPMYGQPQYPTQHLGANQENYQMMPQQMMMAPHMSPYMACTPCHMWPAPQGQWGYPTPVRYY